MDEFREAIADYVPDASDIRQVTEYEVYLAGRPVAVRVFDDGGTSGRPRFSVEAYLRDLPLDERHEGSGGYSLSHAEHTIRAAISGVHWDKLQRDE